MRFIILTIVWLVFVLGGVGYIGIYLCGYGGLNQAIEAFAKSPVDSSNAAIGIIRFLCTFVVCTLSFWIPTVIAVTVAKVI